MKSGPPSGVTRHASAWPTEADPQEPHMPCLTGPTQHQLEALYVVHL